MPIVRNPSIATALIQDRKAANTNGGTFSSGAWRTRDLNFLSSSIAGISLASNQFALPAGRYILHSTAPAHAVDRHQSRLFDVSGNTVAVDASAQEIYSEKLAASTSAGNTSVSTIFAQLQLASAKTFRLEHYCTSSFSTYGFGVGDSFTTSPSIFTQVLILKI